MDYFSICLALTCVFAAVNGQAGEKTWLFAVSGNRRPYNFEDDVGHLVGADVDLIKDVCAIAGKKCELTVQRSASCVITERNRFYPGDGIMAGWFDACVSRADTPERENTVDFTLPFRKTHARFTILNGNPRNFSMGNLQNAVIGQLNGQYTSRQCLERAGMAAKEIVIANGIDNARELLNSQAIDALFSPRTSFGLEFTVLPEEVSCGIKGSSMMVKKGSELPTWWNPAFIQYYQSGAYNAACSQINVKYGGFPASQDCLDPPDNNEKALRMRPVPKSIQEMVARFLPNFRFRN